MLRLNPVQKHTTMSCCFRYEITPNFKAAFYIFNAKSFKHKTVVDIVLKWRFDSINHVHGNYINAYQIISWSMLFDDNLLDI